MKRSTRHDERAVHPLLLSGAAVWGALTAVAPFVLSTRLPALLPWVAAGAVVIVTALSARLAGLMPLRASAFDRRLSGKR